MAIYAIKLETSTAESYTALILANILLSVQEIRKKMIKKSIFVIFFQTLPHPYHTADLVPYIPYTTSRFDIGLYVDSTNIESSKVIP